VEQLLAAQEAARKKDSRTNYEVFAAADGVLRVTEFYELPRQFLKYGACEATLIRSRNTQSNDLSIALRLDFKDNQGSSGQSYLDLDEIHSLNAALKYMLQHRDALIREARTYCEVDYRSRSGFAAGFYVKKEEVGEYMIVGGVIAFVRSLSQLVGFIDQALFKLETLNTPT